MLDIVLNCITPLLLTTILGIIFKELKENKENNKVMQESMVLLLRSQITGKCEIYLKLVKKYGTIILDKELYENEM